MYEIKMNPVKYEDLDFGSRYWITKQGYIYDTILEDFIPWAAYDRYPLCILIDVFGNHHNLMVHLNSPDLTIPCLSINLLVK